MDASRFDDLAKSLSARLTRRGGLGLLAALGLGARVDLAGIDAKKKKKKKKKKRKPPCTVSNSETASTTNLRVTVKDLSLTSSESIQNAGGGLTSTTTIRQKRALVLQMNASFQGGLATIEILYGKAYKGIARADLTSDGETVSGTIDGRAIVPFAASAQPTSIQFQDGQPAPNMSLNGKLNRQLTQLYTKAAAQAQTCSGVAAQLHDSRQCLSCVAGCAAAAVLALKGATAGCAAASALCLFGAPACFAGCMAVALVATGLAAEVCVDICARNPCCAVPCHHANGDPFCCEGGETCLRPGVCCRAGQTPCGGQTCCPSADRCVRGACCLPPDFVCGSTCVGPFTTCCGGTTVCNGTCIGSSCCSGGFNCGGFCCPNANRCCNNVCCAAGQVCDPVTGACSTNCAFRCGPNNECCQTGDVCCGNFSCRPRALCPS